MLRIIVKEVCQCGPDSFEERFRTLDIECASLEDLLTRFTFVGVEIRKKDDVKT